MAEGNAAAWASGNPANPPQPARSAPPRKKHGSDFNIAAHGLRGIAALMVFWGHLLGGTAKHIYDGDPSYGKAVEAMWHLGTAGVVLFFVISGFVIWPSVIRYSAGQFAARRFMRLYPLFFVLTLLFMGLNLVTNAYPHLNSAKAIVAAFTFTNIFVGTEQLTPNAWSLTFEVIFYALTCAVVTFAIHRPHRAALILSGVVSLCFLLIFPIASFFLGGIVVRLLHDRGGAPPVLVARVLELIALICFALYASMAWFAYVPADFANPIALMILSSSLIYFYLAVLPTSLTTWCLRSSQALYAGTVSYSLYLVHPYTYYLCRIAFDRMGLFTDHQFASMALFFVVTTPITLIATHFVHRTVEMMPYRWAFGQKIYRAPVDVPLAREPEDRAAPGTAES
ncbi:MAG: acyltransferase [Sphingobium sp.]